MSARALLTGITALFLATGTAQAQGPGEISRPQLQRAQAYVRQGAYRNDPAYLACIRSRTTAAIKRGDPRALRSVEETRRNGTAIGTPAFQSLLRENERACSR
jgi:hypothetical protein